MKTKNFKNTIEWYDEHAEEYTNASFKTASYDLIDTFFGYLPPKPIILDAGCGSGRDSELFYKKGATVTGLDISKGLLKIAKREYAHIKFVEGSFLDIPFEDEIFDAVWAHAALVHLEETKDVEKSLSEFRRVLKKGGIVHILVREKTQNEIEDTYYDKERYFRYFTKEEMDQFVEKAGFTIRESFLRQRPGGRKEFKWVCIFAEK